VDGNISLCVFKNFRIEAEKLGFPTNFTIYDTDDSKSLLKSIIKELGLDENSTSQV
jgi:DNA helicase-2/ATP-dependent DNA helicase PcrA